MMNQAAPVVATALLYSLYAGVISYAILRIVLAAFKKMRPIYTYHLCNIALVIPLAVFVVSLAELPQVIQTAPIAPTMPAVSMNTHIISQPVGNISTATVAADTHLQPGEIWMIVNDTIMANSSYIMLLYLSGLFIFSVRLLLQYLQSRNLKTKGIEPVNEIWRGLFEQTKKQLGIHSAIRIAFTSRNISPCIIGHAKAIILIPVSIANNLTTEQAEAILLHELAHYKQYDHYINLIIQCTKCILFFNPFVWLTVRLCDSYRELACDDTATRHDRNIELAETLAIIAQMSTAHNSLAMNLKKRSSLLVRIQALLKINPQEKTSHRWLPVIVTTVLLTTALMIGGSTKLFSTEKDKLKEQLEEISAEMYREGNEKYIFVDAVIDSLIILPSYADMLYMGDSYWGMDGNKGKIAIPERTKEKYIAKLQRFLTAQGEDKYAVVRFDATHERKLLTLDDILNPSSAFRKVNLADKYNASITTKAWKEIFAEMYDDGLIRNRDEHFEMKYGIKGIEVNGAKLTGTNDTKYRRLYKDILGLDLDNASVSGRMSSGDLKKYLVDESAATDTATVRFTKEELQEISLDLFKEGQIEYIITDAIKDGLLIDGEHFSINFHDSEVSFSGKTMNREMKEDYNYKYRLYRKYYGGSYCYGTVKNRVNFKQIADTGSGFRHGDYLFSERSEQWGKDISYILGELHKEGWIDTTKKTNISFNYSNVEVNFAPLKGKVAEKYIQLFRKACQQLHPEDTTYTSVSLHHNEPYAPRKSTQGKEEILTITSDRMFWGGLQSYAIIDAIKDGYIKEGEPYSINYRGGVFSIDGKNIPADVRKRYEHKLEQFRALYGDSVNMWGTISSKVEGNYWEPEFTKQFGIMLPKPSKADREKELEVKKQEATMKSIVRDMHKDGLLDSAGYYLIEYRRDGVYVNARKLSGKPGYKYAVAFDGLGYKAGHGLIQEAIPDGVKIRDIRHGNSTIEVMSHGTNLPAIAEVMFVDGNPNFILVYAIQDGLLKERQNYDYDFAKGKTYWNNKLLAEPLQTKYTRLMQDFLEAHNSKTESYRMQGGGFTKKELNNPDSRIRENRINDGRNADGEDFVTTVIKMMAKDGLIDTTKKHEMKYNANGIFVNGRKLNETEAARYEPILEKGFGHKPKRISGDEVSYKNHP